MARLSWAEASAEGAPLTTACCNSKGCCCRAWTGWSREAWQDTAAFMSVAVPSTAMTALHWWSYELIIIFAGKPRDNFPKACSSSC